jgi:hypothetical protein
LLSFYARVGAVLGETQLIDMTSKPSGALSPIVIAKAAI